MKISAIVALAEGVKKVAMGAGAEESPGTPEFISYGLLGNIHTNVNISLVL